MTEAALSEAEELVREGKRSTARGRPWRDRTHCLRGHPYTPENILWRRHGARRCRICHNAASRKWHANRKARRMTEKRTEAA